MTIYHYRLSATFTSDEDRAKYYTIEHSRIPFIAKMAKGWIRQLQREVFWRKEK